jgi:hypothetical protein
VEEVGKESKGDAEIVLCAETLNGKKKIFLFNLLPSFTCVVFVQVQIFKFQAVFLIHCNFLCFFKCVLISSLLFSCY